MKKENYTCLHFVSRTFPLFLMLLFVNVGWGQYSGSGTFNQITDIDDLTDGYYVVVNSGDTFAMNNTTPGTYIGNTAIVPSIGTISNPTTAIVWKIETVGSDKTIFNEVVSKYVGYSGSGNSAQLVTSGSADSEKWIVTYGNGTFKFNNKGVSTRILQYNSGSPRFACYTSAQQQLLLYKLAAPTNVVPNVSDVAIAGLTNTGVQLMGSYEYADTDGDVDASTFQWYAATDEMGTGSTAIDGATALNYTLTNNELGKYIRLGVLAASATGTTPGTEVFSPWIGPVNAAGTPVLNAGLLAEFAATCLNTTTAANSFTLMGNNLESNVTVGSLSGYSFSETENGTYTASLVLIPVSEVINTTVYVKFTPTNVQSYNGMIEISGGGATAINVVAVGSGINIPVISTTDISFGSSASSATLTGSLTQGCSPVSAYGFEYSTTNNFTNGSGISVPSININAGNFTITLTELLSNTTYYYKAFATDGTGTVYGAQSSFMTSLISNPVAISASAITQNGFTANWEAVAGANSYEIDVYEVVAGANATDLFISEYIEGSSNNKYIEIFNGTGAEVDLSNYELKSYSNGSTAATTNPLTGMLANNATIVYRNSSATIYQGTATVASATNFNGDDAVALYKVSTTSLVDIFGRIGNDPGSAWTGDGGYSTVNKTLVRKATVSGGITVSPEGTGASAFTTLTSEWDLYDEDTISNLGFHTFSGGSSATLIVDNQNVGNVTSFSVTGLSPDSEYYYVVRAIDANSTSESSNEISVSTLVGSTTYENGTWSNGVPTADMNAIILSDFTTTTDLEAKSLTVTSGIFTVATGTTLTVTDGIVNNSIQQGVDTFVVQNNAVVLQNSDLDNTGMFTVKRNSFSLFRQDYTLWSSPVSGQNLRSFSPQTLFNRFSSYDTAAGTIGEYQQELFTETDINTKVFEIAKGYLIRMPNDWVLNENSNIAQPYLGSFKGNLNNGDISIALSDASAKFNLVGNPYPSPISISEFFTANPNIEQTLYFWRKTNGEAGSGYATSTGLGLTSTQPEVVGASMQNTIKPGQGFLIKNVTATTLNFNNEMRTNTAGTLFLKSSNNNPTELNRFWLNLSDANSIVGQALIGYATGATQGFDNGLDAVYFNDSALALTSLINTNEYIIQARSLPFVDTDVVSLGFKSDIAATFTISLSNFDGLFTENQAIYLKDNVTGSFTNLKLADYTFATPVGIFNERFEVHYNNSTLGTNNPIQAESTVVIGVKNQIITINAGTFLMEKVELIDVSGRIIYSRDSINLSSTTLENISSENQMLIVRITTKDNNVINKKIIL